MKNRRRQYWVGDGDHKGILIIAGALVMALILIASGLFYIVANRNLEDATYRAHFDILRNTMQMLLPWLVMANIIGLVIVMLIAVLLTHRISGPAYHIVRDIRAIGDGDLTIQTIFRKNDRFQNIAATLTEAASSLRATIADVKNGVADIGDIVGDRPEIREKLERVAKNLEKLKT